MCHTLDPDGRVELHPQTLAPADLLLTKLQVVKINAKDIIDAQALLLGHQVEHGTGDLIDLGRLVTVTSRDWGWFTTFTETLARLTSAMDPLQPQAAAGQFAAHVDASRRPLRAEP